MTSVAVLFLLWLLLLQTTAGRTTEPALLQPNQHTHLGLPVCRVVNDSQGLNLRGCEMDGGRRQWKYVRDIPNTKKNITSKRCYSMQQMHFQLATVDSIHDCLVFADRRSAHWEDQVYCVRGLYQCKDCHSMWQWNQSHLALGATVPYSFVLLLGKGLAELGDTLKIVVCDKVSIVGMACDSLEGLLAENLRRSHGSI